MQPTGRTGAGLRAGGTPAIELRADMQAREAVRRADEADDGVEVHQGRAAPVHGDR